MEKEKPSCCKKESRLRRLKVTVIYGDAPLMECMKHVIRAKHNLR